jgi:hypothetical protein
MRAEFYKLDEPELVIGSAEWDGHRAVITAFGDEAKATIERIFRVSMVAVDDPAMLPGGASGPAVFEPGDLDWFRAAAAVRGAAQGYGVRFATDKPGGWDPALDPQTYGWAGKKPALPLES